MAGTNIANEKLEALRRKQEAVKNQIAQELVREQKKRAKEESKIRFAVGTALILNAAKHDDFAKMLRGILQTSTSLSESDKKLLRAHGWL